MHAAQKENITVKFSIRAVLLILLASTAFEGCATKRPATPVISTTQTLWQIGVPDHSPGEFALGPGGYAKFATDPVYVVGMSDAKEEWPCVQPGPADAWARSLQHTFTIYFGIEGSPPSGVYQLVFDLADTRSAAPPTLEIGLNDQKWTHQMPPGAGGNSPSGKSSAGKECVLSLPIPAEALKAGTNKLVITTVSGGWMLYDALLFEAPAEARLATVKGMTLLRRADVLPVLVERSGALRQLLRQTIQHTGEPVEAALQIGREAPLPVSLKPGLQTIEVAIATVAEATRVPVVLAAGDSVLASYELDLRPSRKWEVYLLPHSHVDIGYTNLQSEVEQKQVQNLDKGIELGRASAGEPSGAQHKWNSEVLWAVDSYMRQATPEKRQALIDAVRKGWVGLDALYSNELTGLCRPEELLEVLGYARRLSSQYGLTIDSAMISDIPGCTWGLVPALAQSGIKYFSIGPNTSTRIGFTRSAWSDRPFYWVSPSGQEKVLVWVAGQGYSWFHGGPLRDERPVFDYLRQLDETNYPYEIVHGRYSIGGDNGPPDDALSAFVKEWNVKYAFPKLILATTGEMFSAFEQRYGDVIPSVSGDFTPYWEDGAGSSAAETAVNREAAERLVQAQTLWAMLGVKDYPVEAFQAAWRNAILYDEHTWGANNSVSKPESDFVKRQWAVKRAFAVDADTQSRDLLNRALGGIAPDSRGTGAVLVLNTNSWPRTGLVVLPPDVARPGDRVTTGTGETVASQRLADGALAMLAKNVPAFGAAKLLLASGDIPKIGNAKADGTTLSNGLLTLTLDPATGAIASLKAQGIAGDLVNREGGRGLNDYLYVAGRYPKAPKGTTKVKIEVKESGPLVASFVVKSDAAGCNTLTREIRVVDGEDCVEIVDLLDKANVFAKEAVHIAFPFNVPKGVVRMETPWAVVRAEADQIPGACKNYFTVQRWVDVANQDLGVTLATVDAPLVEIGAMTCDATAVNWLEQVPGGTTIYSYAMNNYWGTNYKASQGGPATLRYALRPHQRFDAAAAARFGAEQSQSLIVVPVKADTRVPAPVLHLEPSGVLATALKPSDNGRGLMLRLFAASGKPESATIRGAAVSESSLQEEQGDQIAGPVAIPAFGITTLRVTPFKAR